MSEMISGVAGQLFQQILEKQNPNQQMNQSANKRSFESYLQQTQDNPAQQTPTQTQDKPNPAPPTEGAEKIQAPTTSGAEMQKKLDAMEAELSSRFKQSNQDQTNFKQMMPELLDNKSRLGLLKEAYGKVGTSPNTTSDLSGRFTQLETQYKEIEGIMRSDKNLSPSELLALQAKLYHVSQRIEVMSKVVDQMAGGIKTVLNTNV